MGRLENDAQNNYTLKRIDMKKKCRYCWCFPLYLIPSLLFFTWLIKTIIGDPSVLEYIIIILGFLPAVFGLGLGLLFSLIMLLNLLSREGSGNYFHDS